MSALCCTCTVYVLRADGGAAVLPGAGDAHAVSGTLGGAAQQVLPATAHHGSREGHHSDRHQSVSVLPFLLYRTQSHCCP